MGLLRPEYLLAAAGLVSVLAIWLWISNRRLKRTIAYRNDSLADSELLLRELAENIRDVFWITTPKMEELLYCSPTYESVWGRTLESLYANPKSFVEAISLNSRAEVIQLMRDGKAHGYEVEYSIERPDGTTRWIRDRGFPVKDASGNVHRTVGICQDLTEQRHSETRLREAAIGLERLTRRLVQLQESERQELARELHDRVGQYLTALNISLSIVSNQLSEDASQELRDRMADSEVLIEATTAAIRNVVSELRPPMLDDHGLIPALEWHAARFSTRTGLSVVVHGLETADHPAADVEIALFRIAQEALNNVAKHAAASEVEILVERSLREYVMTIDDNGVGVDTARAREAMGSGLGIVTMRERAHAVDGSFELTALPGNGTRLTVRAPAP